MRQRSGKHVPVLTSYILVAGIKFKKSMSVLKNNTISKFQHAIFYTIYTAYWVQADVNDSQMIVLCFIYFSCSIQATCGNTVKHCGGIFLLTYCNINGNDDLCPRDQAYVMRKEHCCYLASS